MENESENQRTAQLEEIIREQKRYHDEGTTSLRSEIERFNDNSIYEDNSSLNHLLALGNEGRRKKDIRTKFHKIESSSNLRQRISAKSVNGVR